MNSRRTFLRKSACAVAAISTGLPTLGSANQITISNLDFQDLPKNLLKGLPEITHDDLLSRQNQARKWMQKLNIDVLFIEGGVNLSYFMDVNWWSSERLFGFLLSPDHEPVWISPAFEKQRAEELIKFGKDIMTWHEHESPYKLIDIYLKNIGKPGGKVGLGPNVRNFIHEGFKRDSGAELVDGAAITENVRAVKTDKEIQFMDVANRITKLAYKKGFDNLREDMSPGELGQIIRDAHTAMGVSGGGGPLFGENAAFPHGTKNIRNLREGDVILVDGGCSVKGYRSDVTRTIVFGKPSDKIKEVWDTVWRAQLAAFKVIHDGIPCENADMAARNIVAQAGYGKDYENFTHRLGHGIGMEGHEYPYLVRGNKTPMKRGITFTNEPGIYLYGEFGIRIEDSFVVTDEGYKILGGMPCLSLEVPMGE